MSGALEQGLRRHLPPERLAKLAAARVGLAGAGGLGSNCAMMLARSGIGQLVLVDGDEVEASNLNRQHYFPRHLGQGKALALGEQIRELGAMHVDARRVRLDARNIPDILALAPIWVEALDDPATKRLFVEEAMRAGVFCVSASGLAGWGGPPMQRRVLAYRDGSPRLVLVGDFSSAVSETLPPLAPRVTQAAAMQADAVLEHILGAG
ncbi:MAG: sulfur carrier protein ThiS adenylyltransferase ThiF [Deltaproteobacteria bacterium]|jgi:sulfur carrier protein ThiS adenylyltransferase|nr:sulfur carrier protein ThiS adenylyltransferase ThiF [Deltaproteobacteria bacterium]